MSATQPHVVLDVHQLPFKEVYEGVDEEEYVRKLLVVPDPRVDSSFYLFPSQSLLHSPSCR